MRFRGQYWLNRGISQFFHHLISNSLVSAAEARKLPSTGVLSVMARLQQLIATVDLTFTFPKHHLV